MDEATDRQTDGSADRRDYKLASGRIDTGIMKTS